jgi:hypothetical protein
MIRGLSRRQWRRAAVLFLALVAATCFLSCGYGTLVAVATVGGTVHFFAPWVVTLTTEVDSAVTSPPSSSSSPPRLGTTLTPADPGYLSQCLTVKDEPLDVLENVEYHRRVGVSRIYVLDTGSVPPLKPLLLPHIASGLVVYSYVLFPWHAVLSVFVTTPSPQEQTQAMCLSRWGARHRFMAFTDVDEFLVAKDAAPATGTPFLQFFRNGSTTGSTDRRVGNTSTSHRDRRPSVPLPGVSGHPSTTTSPPLPPLLGALPPYERYGGLVLNWVVFGSSGHVRRPPGPVLGAYHRCFPAVTVKSIVVPAHTLSSSPNPHWFVYQPGYFAVNERGERVDGWANDPPLVSRLFINHYAAKVSVVL